MFATMRAADGCGLAAQQVGLTQAICVVEVPPSADVEEEGGPRLNPDSLLKLALVNPKILQVSDRVWSLNEGCLSFPDIRGSVQRPWSVLVEYLTPDGESRCDLFHGFLARAVQHELDHLAGTLFCDRFSAVRKLSAAKKLKRLETATLSALA
jgi:peptide deformylase